jgi:hypothetical protein
MGLPVGYIVEPYTETITTLSTPDWPYTITFTRESWRCKDPQGKVVYAGAFEASCRQQAETLLQSRGA